MNEIVKLNLLKELLEDSGLSKYDAEDMTEAIGRKYGQEIPLERALMVCVMALGNQIKELREQVGKLEERA